MIPRALHFYQAKKQGGAPIQKGAPIRIYTVLKVNHIDVNIVLTTFVLVLSSR